MKTQVRNRKNEVFSCEVTSGCQINRGELLNESQLAISKPEGTLAASPPAMAHGSGTKATEPFRASEGAVSVDMRRN